MNKVINWFCGSFIRTIGRFLAFVVIGMLVATLLQQSNIKITDLLGIQRVSASTFDTLWVPLYSDSNRTQNFNTATLTSNINNNMTTTRFYFANNKNLHYFNGKDYTGGQLKMPFTLTVPILSLQNSNTINGTDVCDRWEYYTITTNENVLAWSCEHWSSNSDSTINDREFIFPTTSLKATLHTLKDNVSFYVSCQIKDNSIYCPIGEQQEILDYIDIDTNVQYGSTSLTKQYTFNFDNFVQIEYDGTTSAINNQTTTITSNQNANTNATIENQNQNTQATIDSQMVCNKIDKNAIKKDGYYLGDNGQEYAYNIFGITDYIQISENTQIKVLETLNNSAAYYCFYNINKQKISCYGSNTLILNQNVLIPNEASYIKFSIRNDVNKPQLNICTNGNQAMTNTITNSDIGDADSEASSFFNSFSTTDNGGLSSIITAPLSAIQSLTSSSCSALVLPLPFVNQNLTLPCMRSIYESFFGDFIVIYDIITTGIISYWILVRIFNLVKDFKNPEHDEIEVVDL